MIRDRSMNSRTSRPRSPTNPITFMSLWACLATMPSSVDFPTPDPDIMPILCPAPTVRNEFIARTPISKQSLMRLRVTGFGGAR